MYNALLVERFGNYGMVDVGVTDHKFVSVTLKPLTSGEVYYNVIGVHSNFNDAYDTAKALDKSGIIIEFKLDSNSRLITDELT